VPIDMSAADPRSRIEELRAQIAYHNRRYHELDEPEIADADYDVLVRELQRLEAEHPELITTDSPSRMVGSTPSVAFSPVVHRVAMTSLDNAMDGAELGAWGDRIAKGLAERRRSSCAN
jgi:DNA ligase (NAD+)